MSARTILFSAAAAAAVAVIIAGGDDQVVVRQPAAAKAAPAPTTAPTVTPSGPCTSGELPAAGTPRRDSLRRKPLPVPAAYDRLYRAAGKEYGIPWQLLAGVGMIETEHGAMKGTSSAGARGPMQFMPSTWADYGVDGNKDGRKDITDPADAVPAAAKYLTASGAKTDVRRALFAYNRADWYVNDVLFYAAGYGATGCTEPAPKVPTTGVPVELGKAVAWAASKEGSPYVWGGTGPSAWDCSGLTQDTYRRAGVDLPRTAEAQRSWLATGHGTKIQPGRERPGDLLFSGSPAHHVVIVFDPAKKRTIEAMQTCRAQHKGPGIDCGVGHFDYARRIERGGVIYRVNDASR